MSQGRIERGDDHIDAHVVDTLARHQRLRNISRHEEDGSLLRKTLDEHSVVARDSTDPADVAHVAVDAFDGDLVLEGDGETAAMRGGERSKRKRRGGMGRKPWEEGRTNRRLSAYTSCVDSREQTHCKGPTGPDFLKISSSSFALSSALSKKTSFKQFTSE